MSADPSAPKLSTVPYESLEIGERAGPYREEVGAELADSLRGQIGEQRPGSVIGPAVLPILFLKALRRSMGGIPSGSILAGQEIYLEKEVPVDGAVEIETWVAEKSERKGRRFVVIEFEIRDLGGEIVGGGSKTVIWPQPEVNDV